MKRTNQCPKCGCRDIIADAKPIEAESHADLLIATYRKPDAVLFKGSQTSRVSAWVCAECGYLEFYADSPKALRV
ncbi:MAG: hypothetical protein EOP88_12585 [Verrucomicrobiaceae bacterium]|nr:MAG: hypothetical protein EOP88_12585 [Verrucomicrobiaceae bacterium]